MLTWKILSNLLNFDLGPISEDDSPEYVPVIPVYEPASVIKTERFPSKSPSPIRYRWFWNYRPPVTTYLLKNKIFKPFLNARFYNFTQE